MATKSLCSVPGCGKPFNAKGYCRNHYRRFRVHGDPLAGKAAQGEPLAWLQRHSDHQGKECLFWPYAHFPNGYAAIVANGTTKNASNIMCSIVNGDPSSENAFALHECNNGHLGCVHPAHVRWGSQRDNMTDSVNAGTRCRGETQHAAKLTENDVREIRALRGLVTQKELGERFCIDPESVGRIQRRKAWAWLE